MTSLTRFKPNNRNNFGKNTETAVKNFQQYAGPFLGGLNVDGIVGAATKEAVRHPAID